MLMTFKVLAFTSPALVALLTPAAAGANTACCCDECCESCCDTSACCAQVEDATVQVEPTLSENSTECCGGSCCGGACCKSKA